jgi:hypothetical protein
MSYFIFDMDETLAELYSVYYFVASLRLKESYHDHNPNLANIIPDDILMSLKLSYRIFVRQVLNVEKSNHPLGILRPGLLDVMTKLHELQKSGKIKSVIIYSNNGHLESLEFIRDLIHEHVGTATLIKECIHWNHPMRESERNGQEVGAASKTWATLKKIMVEGNCKAPQNLEPRQVFFFDDLNHKDLQEKLGTHYYKVPAYDFKASFDRIAHIYRNAIYYGKVAIPIFSDFVFELFIDDKRKKYMYDDEILDDMIEMFRLQTKGTANIITQPPPPDEGIDMMISAMKSLNISGGKRRLIKSKGSTIKRTQAKRSRAASRKN